MSTPITSVEIALRDEDQKRLDRNAISNERLFDLINQSVYLKEPEAAKRLKVSVSTLRKWRGEGWLRFFGKDDRYISYRVDQLDADMEAHCLVKATHPDLLFQARTTKSKRHRA